jgi:hypothetical protein
MPNMWARTYSGEKQGNGLPKLRIQSTKRPSPNTLGIESNTQSPGGPTLDGSPMPLDSTATHEPTGIPKTLWTVQLINNKNKHPGMNEGTMGL